MRVRTVLAAVAVLVAAALATAGCSSADGAQPSSTSGQKLASGPYLGVGLIPPLPRPTFTLTDTAGRTYDFGTRTAGRPTLLFFGYTRCTDICPATMADIGNALRTMPKAQQRKVIVVFVSTDVAHDTSPLIAKWLENFTPASTATFVGLRGTQEQIDAAQAAAHVMIAEDGGATHSSQVLLYGPDDYAHVSFVYNGANEEKQMEHDIPLVVRSAA